MTDEEKLDTLGPERTPDFCITIDFPENTKNPQRLFKAAASYIDALQSLDSLLISSVTPSIRPVFVLEEIEIGCIKMWLKQVLENIDDDALRELNVRKAVGGFLVKSKHKVLKTLEGKKEIPTRDELQQLSNEIHTLAINTDVHALPSYRKIGLAELAEEMKRVTDSFGFLQSGDTMTFQSDDGDILLAPDLIITSDAIVDLLADTTIQNEAEKILMIRKPDMLGSSMWDFRHGKQSISAKIEDFDWLTRYHNGDIALRPGDALHVIMAEQFTYDKNGEIIKELRYITKIIGVKPREVQFELPIVK